MPTVPANAPSSTTTSPKSDGADYEPDEDWKAQLRERIQEGLQSMVADAKENHAAELRKAPDTLKTRTRLKADYEEAMRTINCLASEQYQLELGRERNQRRWTAGVPMTPAWTQYFHEEQQSIMNKIKQSTNLTDNSVRTASENPTEERRFTIPKPSNDPPPALAASPVRSSGSIHSAEHLARSPPRALPEVWKPAISPIEEARKKEQERRDEIRRTEEDARRRVEEARKKEEELQRMEEEVRKKEEEAAKRAEQATKMEAEAKTKEREARIKAQDAERKEEEVKRQQDEARRKAEELNRKEEEAKQRAAQLEQDTEKTKQMQLEAEKLAEDLKRIVEETIKREMDVEERESIVRRREEELMRREAVNFLKEEEAKKKAEENKKKEAAARQEEARKESAKREEERKERARQEEDARKEKARQEEAVRKEKVRHEEEARKERAKREEEERRREEERRKMAKREAEVAEEEARKREEAFQKEAEREAAKRKAEAKREEDMKQKLQADEAKRKEEEAAKRREDHLRRGARLEDFRREQEEKRLQNESQNLDDLFFDHDLKAADPDLMNEQLRVLQEAGYRKREEEIRRTREERKRNDSVGNDSAWPGPSASPGTSPGVSKTVNSPPFPERNHGPPTGGRGSASAWGPSIKQTATASSPAANRSSASTSTRKPRTSSSSSGTNPMSSSPHTPPFSEAERTRKQQEFAESQQEQFRRAQEKLEAERQLKSAGRPLSREELQRVFEHHERLWTRLNTLNDLSWNDFPWPMAKQPSNPDDMSLSLIGAYFQSPLYPNKDKSRTPKDRIKEHIKRWHPDRFETKLLPKVVEDEKERVKAGAGNVARYLSDLLRKENEGNNNMFGD